MGRPCVSDGSCSYDAHRPQTIEGCEAWDVAERARFQLRVGPSGPFAFDLGAMMTTGAALGYCQTGLAEFLPAIEIGFISALAAKADADG